LIQAEALKFKPYRLTWIVKVLITQLIYYALVHEVEKGKIIRVIVEKVGAGKYKFRSVMLHNNKSKSAHQGAF